MDAEKIKKILVIDLAFIGDVILAGVAGTAVDVIATQRVEAAPAKEAQP